MKKIQALCVLLLFTYLMHAQAPVITSFSPVSAKPGDIVNITGTGFDGTSSNNIVFFGSTRAVVTNATATLFSVTVPVGAKFAPISVLNLSNNLMAYSTNSFNPVYSPPKPGITTSDFDPALTFSTGGSSGPGIVSDIDGDGKSDVLIFQPSLTGFSILRNTSNINSISFAASVTITGTNVSVNFTVGDIDGDGKPDVILCGAANANSSFVSIFRNTSTIGTISFAPKIDISIAIPGSVPWSIAIGDLDGDGRSDLAAANGSTTQGTNSITMLRNTGGPGNISFSLGPVLAVTGAPLPRSIVIVDLDGDGRSDIAAANNFANTVSVYRNISNGSLSFEPKVDFPTAMRPTSLVAGDLNGDNRPDLVVTNSYVDANTFNVLRNLSNIGSISFDTLNIRTGGFNPYSVSIGDINGDGKPDLAVGNGGVNGGGSTFNISCHANLGNVGGRLTFSPHTYFFTNNRAPQMAGIVDIDGDGKPELIAGSGNSNLTMVYRNTDIVSTKKYVNDNSLSNNIFTTAVGNNANNGSQGAPFATITHALSQANEGDTIYVDAGSYTEQVTIDKGITIIGAGQNLTSILKPAVTVAPPGPFTEQGVIQTAQNIGDVHIKDISVTGDLSAGVTPIIIQSGGSIKNCKLQNGNQGIFARVDPATNSSAKTFVVENNIINAEYIGVNFAGTNLTASLLNNEIAAFNSGFSTGVFAGIDLGNLPNFTATGNKFSNYAGNAFQINANNSTVSQNSFLGSGVIAIQKGGGNTLNATCNWYGSSDPYVVSSKINGNVNFSPWLVNGTDNDPGTIGFQPVSNSCSGRQMLYVNDNSLTGNIYTTAVGNNANNGSPSAPLATIAAALSKAQAGDTIIVDAGSYSEVVNVTKNITIRGAGMGVTILNGPAAHIVPPPGAFESGIIQSTAGLTDVIIESLTIDGSISDESHGTFIQGGGRISYCELRYVNDGFYFSYISTQPRTAIGNNNYIHHINYVGALFAGNGITAIANNNVIDLTGALYGIGFIGGYGGDGNVVSFTASNNSVINVNGFGLMIGSLQTSQVHNNSITRIGSTYLFIQNVHTVNIDATCNWYGTNDAGVIIPYMSGAITYTPWLTSGADNDVAFGFQPVPGVCNGRQNKFYVNDNTLTGDVFTTAVGNDANIGIPSSPLLTISAALTKASAGDSIFVDAGTYAMANLSINKSVTILGSNYNISPNTPADRLVINPIRNANSLITGSTFTIANNDVRLEGLAFNPGAKPQVTISTTGASNFTFKRNYSIITSGNFLNLNGPSSVPFGQASTFGNYLIDDNRFESQVTLSSLCIVIGALNDVTVNNNAFYTPATSAQRLLTSCVAGNAGLTVNHIYSNNISNAARNEWFSSGAVASARIENNISLNGQRSLVLQMNIAISSDIQVRNNYIESNFTDLAPIQYLRSGNAAAGAIANLLIENNTIIQNATGRTGIPAGILAQHFFNGSNGYTTIRRNKVSFIGDYALFPASGIIGIGFNGNWQNINVEENEIEFNGTNLTSVIPPSGQSSSGISISSDNGANTISLTASVNITGNKINGFRNSFSTYDLSNVAPNTYVGYGNLPAGVGITINNNSFTGDVMSINNGTIGQAATANCNWYGSAAAQNIINKVTLNNVDIAPWLTNGTDNDIATGFQPVPGSCDGYPTVITLDSYTDVTCNGAANGSINITTSYGKSPFTYTWTKDGDANFVSHAEDPINLAPGTYHLSIVDGNGSNIYITSTEADGPGTIVVTITEPSALTASSAGTNVSCFNGTNGTASVTAGGGTLPYTYLWSNGSTNASISNLSAGIYSVTVTDGNGCTKTASYEVTQPALLTATGSGTNVSCFGGSNGTANVTVGGGTLPYSYAWSNGGITQSISGLTIGIYNVTVTDGYGCTKTASYEVTQPALLTATGSGTNVSCFGGSNGTATVTVGGGTLPYSYAWSNGGIAQSISGLTIGIYSVTVTDGNGCMKTASYEVTQPTLLTAVATGTSTSCANSATVVVNGGTLPYSYAWSNGATTQSITSLPAGTYTVTVTDGNGCQATASCTVTATEAFNPSASVVNVSCYGGSNGSITVTNANGTAPFQYSINGVNFQSSNTFGGLSIGTYTITVKDVSGCTGFVTKTITQPTQLVVSPGVVQSTCTGSSTGSISVIVSGGSPSYNYLWTGPGSYNSTQATISGLAAGNYNVLVTDSKGCTASLPFTVTPFPAINVNANVLNVACRGDASGSIDLTVSGGTGSGFTYLWNNGATTQDRSGLVAGIYNVTLTDIGSGCVVTGSYTIIQPASAVNLSATSTNVGGCNTLGTITASGSGGTAPYQYKLDAGPYQNSGSFTGLSGGTYTVWVKDANGCTKSVAKTINDSGSDEFENNNNKGNAKEISLGAMITARIGTSGDVDYFKLSPSNTWIGTYTLSIVQPPTAVAFHLVSSNGTDTLTPIVYSSTYKQYNIPSSGTYYVRVSGTNSLSCYQLTITSGLLTRSSGSYIQQEVTKVKSSKDVFNVGAFPNPSNTSFKIKIESSNIELVNMRIMDASGKLIEERKNINSSQVVTLGERYINGVYLVDIIQGNNRKTIRLVKM